MIEKLKYGYKMSMPLFDEFLCAQAAEAAPDVCFGNAGKKTGADGSVQLGDAYSTNGWDTVSVCSIADLNTAIRRQKTYPMEMEYSMLEKEEETTYTLKGSFEPWFVVTGGDGANINLQISFTDGTFWRDQKAYEIKQCTAMIQVHLNYFPKPEKIAEAGLYELGICIEKEGIQPVSVIYFSSNLPKLSIEPIANTLFAAWLNSEETLKKIHILFATAQLSTFESEEFSWLVPTYSSYAYTDVGGDPAKSKFAVLCMLKERVPPQMHQMPPVQFEEGCNYAFLINREVFVMYQLLPALPLAFEGASSEDFKLNTEDRMSITAEKLSLPSVEYGAIDYYPKLTRMRITVEEGAISSEIDFSTEISPGIVAKTFVRTVHGIRLGCNSKGEPIMEYYEKEDTITRNETEVEPWVVVTEIIAEIIVSVVGYGVGKIVTSVLRRVIVVVIVVITCSLISIVIHVIIERVISEGVQNVLPSIVPMTAAATRYVMWPFQDQSKQPDFTVKDIRLNGTLCFQGVIA